MYARVVFRIEGVSVLLLATCLTGCASLAPLEPGGTVYPPGAHTRYDFVPPHSQTVDVPVTGVQGDATAMEIKIWDQHNKAVVFDGEVTPLEKGNYVVYPIDKAEMVRRYTDNVGTTPPVNLTVRVADKKDPDESFLSKWFRWFGRSDSEEYYIGR